MKQCSKCKLEKQVQEFCKDKRTKSGLYSACKECCNKYIEKIRWKYVKRQKIYSRNWQRKARKDNPKASIDKNMGFAIWNCLKSKKEGRKWEALVGYTINDLVQHLENKFDNNMNWENYGSYWEIDHVKPKSLFTYEDTESLEFIKCWALNNLQPLEKLANRRKQNKFTP